MPFRQWENVRHISGCYVDEDQVLAVLNDLACRQSDIVEDIHKAIRACTWSGCFHDEKKEFLLAELAKAIGMAGNLAHVLDGAEFAAEFAVWGEENREQLRIDSEEMAEMVRQHELSKEA